MKIPSTHILKAGKHPCGIKPLGNYILDQSNPDFKDCRYFGLGNLRCLTDELIYFILSLLSPNELITIGQTSKAFYCFSKVDELWKHFVINQLSDFKWHGKSWRETFIFNCSHKTPYLTKIPVDYFYSDFLFQSWFLSSIEILNEWLIDENIDRRRNLSLEEFQREFEFPGKPVIIEDIVPTWPAYKKWSKKYLCSNYGDQVFVCEAMETTLKNYFDYAENIKEESPFYLFDKHFHKNCPLLLNDFTVPKYFENDLFDQVSPRPDFRWIIAGPSKSGSTFHKDPNGTSAWNATITGKKKWIFFPPNIIPPGVFPSKDGSEVVTPSSIMEWFLLYYEKAKDLKPIECITHPGDLIFVPSGWWHTVLNLEMTIAITQNYVNEINLEKVKHFLNKKQHQISGINCELVPKFVSSFNQKYPTSKRKLDEECQKKEKRTLWDSTSNDEFLLF